MRNKRLPTWLFGLVLALASSNLSATQVDPVTLDQAVRDAGLIFQGTVTKIESRLATDMGPNYEKQFYAFVTFRVERILKGAIEGNNKTFTLPFESCFLADFQKQATALKQNPTMTPVEAIMLQQPAVTERIRDEMGCSIASMPHFQVGNSDILLIGADYAGAMCPLVGWWQGRFSITNNKIYPVAWLTKEGNIDFTAPYGQSEEEKAEKQGRLLPIEATERNWTPPKNSTRMTPDDLAEIIENMVNKTEQSDFMRGKAMEKAVKSADIDDSTYYKAAKYHYEKQQKNKAILKKMYSDNIQNGN